MVFGAENADFELADGNEAVVIPLFKVNKLNCWTFLTGLAIFTDAGIFQQQLEKILIVFQKTGSWKTGGKLFNNLIDLVIVEPMVDDLELFT